MSRYTVTFTQHYTYEIEAENEDAAENEAYEEFESDMRYPVAHTFYDEIEIKCNEEDE